MLIGDIELFPILDAVGDLGELAELFPETPADRWEPFRASYPDLFSGTSWRLRCASFLVRAGGMTVLVDTGAGPPGLWDWDTQSEGGLPDARAELGVARDEVDVVFLTHLHIDHLGWNTDRDGVVFFPRARYAVHGDALAFALTQRTEPHIERCIVPLADRFEQVSGGVELAPGVTAFPAPGHYPGHMGVRLRSGQDEAVLIADTAVHPAQLAEPDLVYESDGDPVACAATRRALLPELVDGDVLVACGHYPGSGIGSLVTRKGHVVWEEAD